MSAPCIPGSRTRLSEHSSSVVLLLLFVLGLASCSGKNGAASNSASSVNSPTSSPVAQDSPVQSVAPKKIFGTGEAVPAGYLGYKVLGSWFKDQSTGKNAKPGATSNLYVDLAIVNTDKKERAVAPMKLVDETGKEYSLNEKAVSQQPSVAQVGMVAPSQSKRAVAAFEVPRGHEYKLKIQGFSSTDEVQIKLKPAANPPAQ